MKEKIPIVEVFESIQGEGLFQGRHALFIRVAGCNLRCRWCDTRYAWKLSEARNVGIESLVRRIKNYSQKKKGIVVFTGGEPMLYQEKILEILELTQFHLFGVVIETNGTIAPSEELDGMLDEVNGFLAVSPKLMNSGNWKDKGQMYSKYRKSFRELCVGAYNRYFKFVVESRKDLKEVDEFVRKFEIDKDQVWLMPQARTKKEIVRLLPKVWNWCVRKGYNLSARLHVIAFGGKRGV